MDLDQVTLVNVDQMNVSDLHVYLIENAFDRMRLDQEFYLLYIKIKRINR